MKAAVATESGLEIQEVPRPELKSFELLVKVRAAGLNRADLSAARGQDGHGAVGATIGLDWAGEVVEVGAEAKGGFKPGERVMCAGAGGYAEYAVCDWCRVVSIPDDMSFEDAATLPVALKEYGADVSLDTTDPTWPELVLDTTGGTGVNLIIDQISGILMNGNMKAAAILGRIVNVGRLGGGLAEFDFDLHANRRITYIGVTHRTRSVDELREETRAMWADLADAVKKRN